MTNEQLAFAAKLIAESMKAGNMNKVTDIYNTISTQMSMEEAAKLEQLIAALMG